MRLNRWKQKMGEASNSRFLTKREMNSLLVERRNLLSSKSNFFVREAYKTLRTNVSFALNGEKSGNVIVVTSSLKDEGKSVTAINLAISYAMADYKVLVIDCDLRRPKIARLLQLNSKVGLSNLISNIDLIEDAVLPTQVPGLEVIPSGDIPPNPSELLGSSQMLNILETMRKRYDFIILDSPPVNIVTDSVILGSRSDGILFVVRSKCSERGAVIHAIDQLEYAKIKILGFVLNDVDIEKMHYSAYRYRRYKYDDGYNSYGL